MTNALIFGDTDAHVAHVNGSTLLKTYFNNNNKVALLFA